MNRLVFSVVRKTAIIFGSQKKVIISGQDFLEDDKSINIFGEQLLTLCGNFDLVIFNGLDRWGRIQEISHETLTMAQVWWIMEFAHMACVRKWRKFGLGIKSGI